MGLRPQSCADESLVLLVGSIMPAWSVGDWSTKLGVGREASFLDPQSLATETPTKELQEIPYLR